MMTIKQALLGEIHDMKVLVGDKELLDAKVRLDAEERARLVRLIRMASNYDLSGGMSVADFTEHHLRVSKATVVSFSSGRQDRYRIRTLLSLLYDLEFYLKSME